MKPDRNVLLALEAFHDDIAAQFSSVLPEVEFAFGWRAQYRRLEGTCRARIITRPGDMTGNVGTDTPPRRQGLNPDHVADLDEKATVYLRAYDATSPEGDEYDRYQYRIGRMLFDAWRTAARNAASGTFRLGESKWLLASVEAGKGVEIAVPLIVQSPILDYFEDATNAAPLRSAIQVSMATPTEGT